MASASIQKRFPKLTGDQLELLVSAVLSRIDQMSELGETESIRLQMAMDRRSKFMTALSNILKKTSDTSASIVQNLK